MPETKYTSGSLGASLRALAAARSAVPKSSFLASSACARQRCARHSLGASLHASVAVFTDAVWWPR